MDNNEQFYFWDEMWNEIKTNDDKNEKDITKNGLEDKSMDDKD